jgi:hypothetical protein
MNLLMGLVVKLPSNVLWLETCQDEATEVPESQTYMVTR